MARSFMEVFFTARAIFSFGNATAGEMDFGLNVTPAEESIAFPSNSSWTCISPSNNELYQHVQDSKAAAGRRRTVDNEFPLLRDGSTVVDEC